MPPKAPTECQRTVLSCARCRRRKIKCDRKLPSCSQCVSSGSTCTGFDTARDTEVPRSLVQYLEHEIARVEAELGRREQLELQATNRDLSSPNSAGANGNSVVTHDGEQYHPASLPATAFEADMRQVEVDNYIEGTVRSDEVQRMISATIPPDPSLTDVVCQVRIGLTPSVVLSPLREDAQTRNLTRKSHPERRVDASILISLPSHIVHGLVRKFIQRVLPIYPFLDESEIWEQLKRVQQKTPQQNDVADGTASPTAEDDYDFLIIYLILAISATLGSAKGGHEERCMSFSESLFIEGTQHASNKAPAPSGLGQIQANLLILQYATINPKSANVWIVNGVVMRSCLELGLHREVRESFGIDPATVDLRRRIFWVAYCMDRAICSALRRPLSIPDPAIDMASLPEIHRKSNNHNLNGSSGQNRQPISAAKLSALRWIQYAKIQSLVTEVHFQGKPLEPNQSWEEWLSTQEAVLRRWYSSNLPHDEWTEFALNHGLMSLHRPSPRVPMPSAHSLLIAFDAASASAYSCREQIQNDFFRRPWLAAHHTLEMAMVVLFCLRHGYEAISTRFPAEKIFEMTKLFTANFLAIAAQGWGEIAAYAGVYERLLGPLLEGIFTNTRNPMKGFGPAQDAELTRLLYPGPAQLEKLRFVGRARNAKEVEEELVPFDTTILDWNDEGPNGAMQTLGDFFWESGGLLDEFENNGETSGLVL